MKQEIYDFEIIANIEKNKELLKKQYCIICGKFIRKTFVTYELNHKAHLRRYHKNDVQYTLTMTKGYK